MPFHRVPGGPRLYYKDWGSGPTVLFSHGWPLSSDAWESQMVFLGGQGFRCIAHDRRGHGRSEQTWDGHDMDTFADDLGSIIEALDLHEVTLVGHSMGAGEVVRYVGRHGTDRVSKIVLVAGVPPLMLRTPANPLGSPLERFEELREGVLGDRAQFFRDLSAPFFGSKREGFSVSQGVRDWFWWQAMTAGLAPVLDCIRAFSETDFTSDLKKIEVPTLILHGDDDQIVHVEASSLLSAKLVKGSTLKLLRGAPHGLCSTHKDLVNAHLLSFLSTDPSEPPEQASVQKVVA